MTTTMKLCYIYITALLSLTALPMAAQEPEGKTENKTRISSNAWELGIGGTMFNWDRVTFSNFQKLPNGNYYYDMKLHHLMGGAQLYAARQLNKWFYIDAQANIGLAKKELEGKGTNYLFLGGIGMQWRLTPLFKSQYVEPYLRVGINYVNKNFSSVTKGGFEGDVTGQAAWQSTDTWNKSTYIESQRTFFPLSAGVGVNAWLSNSLGLGLEGNYYMPLKKKTPKFAQVSLRIMWRIGGKSKAQQKPVPVYVDRIVEKPIEKIVEKIVYKETPGTHSEKTIYELLSLVDFDFDKYTITKESQKPLDDIAAIMKSNPEKMFLLVGYTDAHGDANYNLKLSANRAAAVKKALVERGVPAEQMRTRGAGKFTAAMPKSETDNARRGDRRVIVEIVTNKEYWDKLPK